MPADRAAEDREAKHKRRLRARRAILALCTAALVAWLVASALSPEIDFAARFLLFLLAALVGLHVVFWQLSGHSWWSRLPRPMDRVLTLLALATAPVVLYPVGMIAVVAAFSIGGAAWPALATAGALILSPIVAIVLLGVAFALSRRSS
jgi:hypothetical protein